MEYKNYSKMIYKINGQKYESLDEMPPEIRNLFTSELIKKLQENMQVSKVEVRSCIGENNLFFKLNKSILYLFLQLQSLLIGQSIFFLINQFEIFKLNTYLSFLLSFVIGNICFFLAEREYARHVNKFKTVDPLVSLGFFKDIGMLIFNIKYLGVFHTIIYLVLIFFNYIKML